MCHLENAFTPFTFEPMLYLEMFTVIMIGLPTDQGKVNQVI